MLVVVPGVGGGGALTRCCTDYLKCNCLCNDCGLGEVKNGRIRNAVFLSGLWFGDYLGCARILVFLQWAKRSDQMEQSMVDISSGLAMVVR